jgi:hypothetical protein
LVASIYYTTNGDTSTVSSSLYTAAVIVNGGTMLKAIAVADGYDNSGVTSLTCSVPDFDQPATIFCGIVTVDVSSYSCSFGYLALYDGIRR